MKYLKDLMKQKHMTRAELCRESDVPDSTVRDILNGKARIDHCEAGTLFDIAAALDTTVEDILGHYWADKLGMTDAVLQTEPCEYRTVKNESALYFYEALDAALRDLKTHGAASFTYFVRSKKCVDIYRKAGRNGCALLFVGLLDYLARMNVRQPAPEYFSERRDRLEHPMYPLRLMDEDLDGYEYEALKQEIMEHAIPELARHNIYLTEEDLQPKS